MWLPVMWLPVMWLPAPVSAFATIYTTSITGRNIRCVIPWGQQGIIHPKKKRERRKTSIIISMFVFSQLYNQ